MNAGQKVSRLHFPGNPSSIRSGTSALEINTRQRGAAALGTDPDGRQFPLRYPIQRHPGAPAGGPTRSCCCSQRRSKSEAQWCGCRSTTERRARRTPAYSERRCSWVMGLGEYRTGGIQSRRRSVHRDALCRLMGHQLFGLSLAPWFANLARRSSGDRRRCHNYALAHGLTIRVGLCCTRYHSRIVTRIGNSFFERRNMRAIGCGSKPATGSK